jgi:hypothetical protein
MTDTQPPVEAHDPDIDSGRTAAAGRWMVAMTAGAFDRPGPTVRPQAAFLTQLLAMRAGVPQARLRMRAEPDVGAAAYRDGLALRRVGPGLPGLDLDA